MQRLNGKDWSVVTDNDHASAKYGTQGSGPAVAILRNGKEKWARNIDAIKGLAAARWQEQSRGWPGGQLARTVRRS